MTVKKHSPWLEKLEKEGLLEENPLWRVEDPTTEECVTIQAESDVTAEDPTRPVDLRTATEREDPTPVVLDQTIRSKDYPNAELRRAMEKRESAVDLPKLASRKPAEAAPAESAVEANWFAQSKPKPNGSYSHTEARRPISVHGRKISVDPQASSDPPAQASGAILDEPPQKSAPPRRTSRAPARFLPDDDVLFGESDEATGAKRLRDAMRECYDLGDFTGALEHAETLLRLEPNDHEALALARDCRSTLEGMYETRLGSITQTPRRAIAMDELVWRRLDPTATFLVSLVDGILSLENIIDICGLPKFEALRILARLKEEGIID